MEQLIVKHEFNLDTNLEKVKTGIEENIKKYDVVITEDGVKDAKEIMANFNKDKKLFKETCKKFLDDISAPITKFKATQKEIEKLFDDGREKIKVQVDKFEEEKLKVINQVIIDYRKIECEEKDIDPDSIVISDLIIFGSVTAKMQPSKKLKDTIASRIQTVENEKLKARLEAEEKAKKQKEFEDKVREEERLKHEKEKQVLIDKANEKIILDSVLLQPFGLMLNSVNEVSEKIKEIENYDITYTLDRNYAEKMKARALDQLKKLLWGKKEEEKRVTTAKQVEVNTNTPFDEKVPVMTVKKSPNKKVAILTFEFDVKGEPTDEQILKRVEAQISDQFKKYLVGKEVL